jgi:hypothetical protein
LLTARRAIRRLASRAALPGRPDRSVSGGSVKALLKRMQHRPGLLDGFLASTGLDLTPFCNTHH